MIPETKSAMALRLKTESALKMFNDEYSSARQFIRACRAIGDAHNANGVRASLAEANNGDGMLEQFSKALVPGMGIDSAWSEYAGESMARAYIGTIAQDNLFDAVAKYAAIIPADVPRVLIASGASANITAEGSPISVTRVDLAHQNPEPKKACALLVYGEELQRATDGEAAKLFERELRSAVVEAFNAAVLSSLSTTAVSATGSAVGDLTAGLKAAAPSRGYVVAVTRSAARELALNSDGRMNIFGGSYIDGVDVVAAVPEDSSGTGPMLIIPASTAALSDFGLTVLNARDATVAMSDSPSSPAEMTSVFQTDNYALRVIRRYRLSTINAIEVS